jgi:chemotaxis protein methyltransferase CheR
MNNTTPQLVDNLSPQEFEHVATLAKQKFGLDLRRGKESLVCARLGKKMREANCSSFKEYFRHVTEDTSGTALINLIDALTTNHTSFLREPQHFEFLVSVIGPKLAAREKFDLWSAACSTGEEPYTIAFHVLEEARKRSMTPQVRIVASDISTKVLSAAQTAIYPEERIQTLPEEWKRRYLLRGVDSRAGSFRVKQDVIQMVEFRRVNLIEPVKMDRKFALVFCRNVMIYFDKQTQAKVVANITEHLEPGGYLFVGHAESLTGISHSLEYVKPAIYRKPGGRQGRNS